jgi:hypothetical protein
MIVMSRFSHKERSLGTRDMGGLAREAEQAAAEAYRVPDTLERIRGQELLVLARPQRKGTTNSGN